MRHRCPAPLTLVAAALALYAGVRPVVARADAGLAVPVASSPSDYQVIFDVSTSGGIVPPAGTNGSGSGPPLTVLSGSSSASLTPEPCTLAFAIPRSLPVHPRSNSAWRSPAPVSPRTASCSSVSMSTARYPRHHSSVSIRCLPTARHPDSRSSTRRASRPTHRAARQPPTPWKPCLPLAIRFRLPNRCLSGSG